MIKYLEIYPITFLKYKSNNGQVYLNSKQYLQFWQQPTTLGKIETTGEVAEGLYIPPIKY